MFNDFVFSFFVSSHHWYAKTPARRNAELETSIHQIWGDKWYIFLSYFRIKHLRSHFFVLSYYRGWRTSTRNKNKTKIKGIRKNGKNRLVVISFCCPFNHDKTKWQKSSTLCLNNEIMFVLYLTKSLGIFYFSFIYISISYLYSSIGECGRRRRL